MCIRDRHAASPDNTSHTYPWPAPLSNNTFKGVTGSLFGMIPATQPGGNPDEALKKSTGDLKAAEIALNSVSTATDQLAAVQQISNLAAYARALYDRLYICLLYTSDAADERSSVDLGGRRFIKKKKNRRKKKKKTIYKKKKDKQREK